MKIVNYLPMAKPEAINNLKNRCDLVLHFCGAGCE
jgi:hypothetical protein